MFILHLQTLLILPIFPSVAFLLWVLWKMHRDARRKPRRY